ncbi:MAG: hypothetical protein OEV05_13165 [Gammaproteobacteria bacterium]|jgi:hypothetical protein|nr:hypothetical protein [Gammaproteobacteria bacterium]MDH4005433.1 hypothetical protein [Gammaproteobacteria bacterium]
MREERVTTTTKRLVAAAMIAVLLSGCSQTKGWLNSVGGSDSDASDEPVIPGAPAADEYLTELSDLSLDDPALQAEIFADSQAAAQLAPSPSTTLRYALVLATPGHPGSDPQQAQSILRELMTQTALMTPAEVALATIYLKSSEQLILLGSEARRLRASTDRAQRTEDAAINQRLATVEAENRRLRQDLEDAESKLEAITSIEQSIRQQDQ